MSVTFHLDQYLRVVGPLATADVDAFVEQPPDEDVLWCRRYMHDVEFHATCYLRDLLVTSAHDDAEITTYRHGKVIAEVLRRRHEPASAARWR